MSTTLLLVATVFLWVTTLSSSSFVKITKGTCTLQDNSRWPIYESTGTDCANAGTYLGWSGTNTIKSDSMPNAVRGCSTIAAAATGPVTPGVTEGANMYENSVETTVNCGDTITSKKPSCWEAYMPDHENCWESASKPQSGYERVGYTCVDLWCAASNPGGTPANCAVEKGTDYIVDYSTGRCVSDTSPSTSDVQTICACFVGPACKDATTNNPPYSDCMCRPDYYVTNSDGLKIGRNNICSVGSYCYQQMSSSESNTKHTGQPICSNTLYPTCDYTDGTYENSQSCICGNRDNYIICSNNNGYYCKTDSSGKLYCATHQ